MNDASNNNIIKHPQTYKKNKNDDKFMIKL